jgi:outer membrane protein TolC
MSRGALEWRTTGIPADVAEPVLGGCAVAAALRILEQEADAEAQAVAAAQQALDISNAQYRAGTSDYLQVIVAKTTLLQAQRTAQDILTRRLIAAYS